LLRFILIQIIFFLTHTQLFIYLFAPVAHHLKESDFHNNFRLENGLKLWQGMWDFRSPNAPCFTAPVKPRARQFLHSMSAATSAEVFTARKYQTTI
jgi:protein unc-80